jgi:hypothetical protein
LIDRIGSAAPKIRKVDSKGDQATMFDEGVKRVNGPGSRAFSARSMIDPRYFQFSACSPTITASTPCSIADKARRYSVSRKGPSLGHISKCPISGPLPASLLPKGSSRIGHDADKGNGDGRRLEIKQPAATSNARQK